jgi:hypothetical protein
MGGEIYIQGQYVPVYGVTGTPASLVLHSRRPSRGANVECISEITRKYD